MSSEKEDLILLLSKDSTPSKDVGTTVDKTLIPVMPSNQMKWRDITLPLFLFPVTIMKDFQKKYLNLVLSNESTPTKDVGTTVDKTLIPV
jgi:hypothetical protein